MYQQNINGNKGISKDDRRQIVTEMQATWDSIAHDVIDLYEDGLVSRDQVVEMVGQKMYDEAPTEWLIYSELSDELRSEIAREAFPENSFGR